MTTRPPTGGHAPRNRLVAVLLLLGALAVACDGTASGTPSTPPPDGSPGASPAASVGLESPGAGAPDFGRAADALAELDSYSFSVEIQARNTLTGGGTVREGTTSMSGTVVNRPEKASSVHLVTADKDGTVTDETEIVILPAAAYLRSGGSKARWNAIPADQAASFSDLADAFRPERMFSLYFVPTGTDSTVVGDETHNDVASTHYRGAEAVDAILGAIVGVSGSWSSDIWLAKDGGYLVAAEARVRGSEANGGGSFSVVVNITEVNAAGPLKPPI